MLRSAIRNGVTSIFSVYKNSRIQIYYNEKLIIITQKVFSYRLATTELRRTKAEKDAVELDPRERLSCPSQTGVPPSSNAADVILGNAKECLHAFYYWRERRQTEAPFLNNKKYKILV